MHPLTRPQGPRKSKCGNELWKQWTEFKPRHVFLWRVSGNGSRPKIKKKKAGEGGLMLQRKKGNDETVAPPPPTHPWEECYGWHVVQSRGSGVGSAWIPSLRADYFSSQEREGERGVKKSGSMPARRSPILVPRTHCHITPLWKRKKKKKKTSGVTQSMCCTSHMCSRGLLNAVIRLCAGSKPQHNNKAGPSSFIILHVPVNPEKVKRPQSRPELRRSLLLGVNSPPRVLFSKGRHWQGLN